MVHIFFVIHLCLFFGVNDCCRNFGRQKERSKEKLSAAPASMKGSERSRDSATRTGQCRILGEVRTVLLDGG
jgi:hypothetical protein